MKAPIRPPVMDTNPLQPELQGVKLLSTRNPKHVPSIFEALIAQVVEPAEGSRLVPSVVLTGHGRLDRIKVMNTPLPQSLRENEVEVQVYYCGLNFTDNYLRLGVVRSAAFPLLMGSECCGVVTRVGDSVDDLQAGQRVLCLRPQGGLLRHVVQLPRALCYPLPRSISLTDAIPPRGPTALLWTDAIALALDYLVAYLCLFDLGRLRKAGVVFMQSLAGGVGTLVAQLARVVPLVTVLGTASEQKHDSLWRLGVHRAYRHQDNFPERALRLYPEGADIVIVRGGGADTDKCLRLTKPGGRLITIGSDSAITYPKTKTKALQRPTWDTSYMSSAELINKNVIVAGLNLGDLIERYPHDVQTVLDTMFDLHFQKRIKPQIHCILPFEKMADGLEVLCARQNFGKVVLEVVDETDPSVPFGRRVPSPPKPIPGSMSWEKLKKRLEMKVMCKRRLDFEERQAEAERKAADVTDDAVFTEVEASMAAEMVRAVSESEAEASASGNL